MEYHNIRNMISSSINYSVFQIKNLNKDTKEMLVGNMTSKIIKDSNIERMLTTEKINIILKSLSTDTSVKKDIIAQIKKLNIVNVISAIDSDIKNGKNTYKTISKYFEELKQLTNIYFDIEYSDKYIMLLIQGLLKNMTEEQVMSIISSVKSTMKMLGGYEKIDIVIDEEKVDIQVGNSISNFLTNNNFDIEEERLNYIHKINTTELNKILKQCEHCEYDCNDFFSKLFMPYINNLSGDRTQYISGNIFNQFLNTCVMTKYLSNQIKEFLSRSEYMKVIISKNKYSIANEYINMLTGHVDMSEYKNLMSSTIEKSYTKSSSFVLINQYSKYVDTSGMTKDFRKNNLEVVLEIMKTVGQTTLKNFITNILFENISIVNELEGIDILTYYQLEQLVISNKFIKVCRGKKKILSGKLIRKIIYHVFNKYGKLNATQEKKEEDKVEKVDILNMNFDAQYLEEKEEKFLNKGISYCKSKRINLCNFKNLMEEQGCDVSDINEEIRQIDNEINKYFMGMSEVDAINENVADLHEYIDQVEGEKETENITSVINYYSKITSSADDNWKVPFEKIEEATKVNTINGALDNIINKYEKEFAKEERKENKENFTVLQSKMIERQIESTLKTFDIKYNTNTSDNTCRIISFVKQNMNNLIKSELYKSYNNKFIVQNLINETITLFCIIFCLMNSDIELKSIYDDIDAISENVKNMGKKLYVKSMDTQGIFKGKYNEKVYVDFGDRVELIDSDDIVMTGSLERKNVIVIKGNHKGVIGTVYKEMSDYVMMTKDIYGKTGTLSIASLKSIKVLKEHVKMYKCQYNDSTLLIDSEIASFFKTKPEDIYPLAKFYYNKNINSSNNENFSFIYSISLKMFNKMKKEEISIFETCKSLKIQFEDGKKTLIGYKKNGDKKFISQKKRVLIIKREYMNAIKVVKNIGNKKNLYLKNNDIKKGCIKYGIEDNTLFIIDNSNKYNAKYTNSSNDHKSFRKKCISTEEKKYTMNKAIDIVSNMLENLMAKCPICLESLDEKITTACNHDFHESCLNTWSKTNDTCPLCRHDLKETC